MVTNESQPANSLEVLSVLNIPQDHKLSNTGIDRNRHIELKANIITSFGKIIGQDSGSINGRFREAHWDASN